MKTFNNTPARITIKDDIDIEPEFLEFHPNTNDDHPYVDVIIRGDLELSQSLGMDFVNIAIMSPAKLRYMAEWLNEAANWIEKNTPQS
jgi:hypothetical protein